MDRLTLTLANLHCEDCASTIKSVISEIYDAVRTDEVRGNLSRTASKYDIGRPKNEVKYKLTDNSLILVSTKGTLSKSKKQVIDALEEKGFDVTFTELETDEPNERSDKLWEPISVISGKVGHRIKAKKLQERHVENCKVCQEELQKQEKNKKKENNRSLFRNAFHITSPSGSSDETLEEPSEVVVKDDIGYRTVIAIGGMTCASCASTVTNAVKDTMESHDVMVNDEAVSVSVITNTAVVIIPNKQLINPLLQAIKDAGYSASLLESLPIERSTKYKVVAGIGGMTCAACSSAIENAVKDLSFVVEHAINVVAKNGVFIIDSASKQNLQALNDAVEDVGFDYELLSVEEISHAAKKSLSRTVNLKISAMFCEHCPEEINAYLSRLGEGVVINDPITLSKPFVKFTYIPSPPNLTIRRILKELNQISPKFDIEIIKPVTLEEHLKKVAQKETMRLVKRLILTILVAIPTFIIGVVIMSLLPSKHHLRKWFMEPIWVGNVSRAVWAVFILATPIYFFADDIFHRKALKEVITLWRHKTSWTRRLCRFGSMNLLMSLGTTVAYFSSIALLALSAEAQKESDGFTTTYFDSVVFLTLFLLIGRLLEAFSKSKTADAVTRLSNIKPSTAHYVQKLGSESEEKDDEFGNDQVLETSLLEAGDYIRVPPGESPAADSVIIRGETKFDESALTGESAPVTHAKGEQIFAGTVNVGTSSVICKISALDGSSLIDQIVSAVQEGQLKKSPIERTADLFSGIFVPVICLLAVITWIIWLALGYSGALSESYLDIDIGGWSVWSLEFAISVFVVACPCGIGLAAPTALFVGSGLAARYGILAKGGGSAFQDGAKVDVVCFDKTGTLTMGGDPKITDYAILQNDAEEWCYQIARDMELSSGHLLSLAVKNFVVDVSKKMGKRLTKTIVSDVTELSGKGLQGELIAKEGIPTAALIGNEALLSHFDCKSLTKKQQVQIEQWKEEGKSIVILALKWKSGFEVDDYVPAMIMAARDQVRPEAKNVISALQKRGISCWMISGDNSTTANAIAKQLGINDVVAEVLPDQKSSKLEWIQRTHFAQEAKKKTRRAVVAMVGDGINDAPALAAADVGIAMGSGSDIALTSSDFVLLSPNYPLVSLLNLLDLSRTVFKRVKFNFGWAVIYNMIGVPIAAGVIYPYNNSRLNPVWASAAMALSSITVVLSSLALKLYHPPKVEMNDTSLSFVEAARVVIEE